MGTLIGNSHRHVATASTAAPASGPTAAANEITPPLMPLSRPSCSGGAYARNIAAGRGADGLHRLPVKAGDVIFSPAGTIHALGPGIMVAEVQQNSDTTYRVYDWGRPRPIHVEKSLEVIDFGLVEPGPTEPRLILSDEPLLKRGDLPLLGAHNVGNALAAALAALEADPAHSSLDARRRIADGLRTARALPHRQ